MTTTMAVLLALAAFIAGLLLGLSLGARLGGEVMRRKILGVVDEQISAAQAKRLGDLL